ncbi:threonine ammonia-lyase [Streptomyces litchfieldiae]|uniref:Pyridoxal-phosphate dependent enzyme n=1 Tax=Streptomyces litchfieldiae TaxID=3075543 RepID=A0ABU2MS06_9ACTN|nr:pyridoxal-phosphate dependent enzyme [Streptomyces sp. DSM 44938]MDT0343389.1 pyridoxal-phosphate dependent enzyme [Streptomyces sp. DSM 44938]
MTDLDLDLDLDRIARAAEVIDPVFLNSPQYADERLCARLGRRVLVKPETLNPLRSFKGRGADFLVGGLPPGSTVVCGSSGGNFGQAVAYAARRHGLAADVFVPADASPVKTDRMTALGARVHRVAEPPKERAAAHAAADPGRVFVVDGRDAAIAEGAGTIGIELLRGEPFDTVVLPLGDGALITGVARWLKAHAPGVRVVGAASAAAPALAESWRSGEVRTVERRSAFAAGISITRPEPEAVCRTRALVDDVVLVEDAELVAAMHLAADTLGLLPEPAGAAGLAAIAARDIPGATVATVLTGANADLALFGGVWSTGPAAATA